MSSYKNNNLLPLLNTSCRRTDCSSVILFTNARDEPNIAEWIAHHLLLGFDKIVVFDHLSKIPIHTIYRHLDAYMLINIVKTRNIDIILLLMTYFGNVNYRILTIDIDIDMMITLAFRMNCIKSFIDNLK